MVNGRKLLDEANRKYYAVGAFNVNNMEICQSIVRAAEAQRAPAYLQTSEGAIEYAGLKTLANLIATEAEQSKVPFALHLDHGRDMEVVKQCIKVGYTSVMYDGSHLQFDDNIKQTKRVVALADKHGIPVEAELGTIGGAEDKIEARQIIYTDPEAAVEFVERTGCHSLAVAVGTSHGAYKFKGTAHLDIDRLRTIKKRLGMPLVLHGASGVPQDVVRKAQMYGAQLGEPEGVPDDQIALAVMNGINKINTDTDLRLSFTAAVREVLSAKPEVFDPRKILAPARDAIQAVVEHRMKLFGSAGKA